MVHNFRLVQFGYHFFAKCALFLSHLPLNLSVCKGNYFIHRSRVQTVTLLQQIYFSIGQHDILHGQPFPQVCCVSLIYTPSYLTRNHWHQNSFRTQFRQQSLEFRFDCSVNEKPFFTQNSNCLQRGTYDAIEPYSCSLIRTSTSCAAYNNISDDNGRSAQ